MKVKYYNLRAWEVQSASKKSKDDRKKKDKKKKKDEKDTFMERDEDIR